MPPPLDFDLHRFERLVHGHAWPEAVDALVEFLINSRNRAPVRIIGTGFTPPHREDDFLHAYSRLAAAVTALIANPAWRPTPTQFNALTLLNRDFSDLFTASVFAHPRHLALLTVDPGPGGKVTVSSGNTLGKLLLCLTLEMQGFAVDTILQQAPTPLAIPALLGLLGNQAVLTRHGEEMRTRLLDLAPSLLDRGQLTPDLLTTATAAWMLCSYAVTPRKHAVKAAINRLVGRYLDARGVHDLPMPPVRPRRERPTMLIMGERIKPGHVMYRVFATTLALLRQRFRTILMAPARDHHPGVAALFDDVVEATDDPAANIAVIQPLQPDIIYYPGLGMEKWTLLLANLRLAPIQCMATGVPASSFSPVMDYFVCSRELAGDAACFSERVVAWHGPPPFVSPLKDPERSFQPVPRQGVIHIALNVATKKLNHHLLDLCQHLVRTLGEEAVHLHFFPHEVGLGLHARTRQLTALLPRVTVHPRLSYEDYLTTLAGCHLALAPFPFANSNSTVDCLLLGMPVVAMDGVEPHARTDRRLFKAMAMPEWLLARDEASYLAAALRLCQDEPLRLELSQWILGQRHRLLGGSDPEQIHDFLAAMTWLHDHHEVIQAHPRRLWLPEERHPLARVSQPDITNP